MRDAAIFKVNAKGCLLGLVLLLCHLFANGQGCSCPAIGDCGPCQGGLTRMTFRYNGFLAIVVSASDNSGTLYFDAFVSNGEIFTIVGTPPSNKFLGNVTLSVNAFPHFVFNPNCSFPFVIGDDYGSFTLLAAESFTGGPLCCAPGDIDFVAPVISSCPANVVVSANASCSALANWVAPTATDNCGNVTLTSTHSPGSSFPQGTTAVTYTATDDYGNSATCSFNVTVNDNTNPVITGCPSNVVVNANASCQAVANWTTPTVSDNCGGTMTLTSTKAPGDLFNIGTTLVTYTATDDAGNTSTCSFNVTVQDNTNPVIAGCPSNVVVNANASCQAIVNWTVPTFSDNCAGGTLTSTRNPGDVFALGTTTVTYTATDAAGNTSTCSFDVTVQDNTNPVITGCPSNIVVSANGSCQATVNWTAPTFSDNCAGGTLTSTRNPGDVFGLGTTTVTYTATDAAGNMSTCSFDVTVQDNTNPVITGCPANILVNANASCQAVANWTAPSMSDNCGGTVTLTSTKSSGDVFALGTTTVTYTATDAAGNTSTCSFDVVVQDNTNPVISGCPSNIAVSANASCQATVNWTAPTFSDNCAGGTLTSTRNPGDVFALGTTTVTYTATDAAGNTSTCSFDVTVQDNTNPVIAGCPSNIVVSANASCQATVNWTAPTFSDNCAGGTLTSTRNPGDVFALGTTTVTYTATDAAGNTSTCSFDVTVQDNTNPIITGCPTNILVSANASCQATVNWTAPTFSDNCGGGTLTSTRNPGDVFGLGTTTVTYTATDAAGNTTTCSFDVTVQDNTNPVITACPANILVNANASCQAVVNWTLPTMSDNCGGTVTLTSTKNPGDIFALGTTTVIYTATDAAGNTSTCSFDVTVQDNTNPVISGCPSNITVSATASCQATVNWTAPTFSDNCAGGTLISTRNTGDVFALGTTTVTYTATDAAGNTSTCSFDVTVQDNTNPVIAGCPSNIVVSANASCQATVNWTAPTFSDNCAGGTLTSTRNPGDVFALGTTTVTYTATDAAGNISTCSFDVTVQDNTNPVIAGCPSNIVVSANASCQATVNWTAPTFSDNCAGGTLTSTRNPGDVFALGTTTVTYTATDAAGNTSTCSFNVIVQDNTNPVITGCPSNIVVSANASCQATVNWTAPTFSDNCAGGTLASSKNPGDVFALGTTTVTYTATDAAGNTSTCSFDVVVLDDTFPAISGCPSNIVVNAAASCQAIVNWTPPTASDNCAGVTLTSTKIPGDVFALGTTTVTYTAQDAAGNATICSFNVVVQDNTTPVINGCPSNIIVNANASCQAVVNWTAPTVTDNCAGATLTSTKSSGDIFSLGTTTVTYTATDAAGNIATCSFDIVVQDNTVPLISGCPSNIVMSVNGSCETAVSWTIPTVSDNCSGTVTLTATKNPGDTFPLGTTTVTYTATDAAGNTAVCSFDVVVQDNTNPVITGCPSNIMANANASCNAAVTWTVPTTSDNCGGPVTLTSNQNPGDIFPVGTTVVTYTATDAAGNASTCSFNVVVEDNTNPMITGCPSDITVNANTSCQMAVSWTVPTASDNCTGVTLASTKNPGDIFPIGTTTVLYTATDARGNTTTCSFNVIVKDNSAPVIAGCPANFSIAANATCQTVVNWTAPTVSDNCAGATLTASKSPGDIFPVGTTVVTYTATDAAGNTSSCSFNVVVEDNTKPLISGCPSDIVVNANGSCQAAVNWTAPTATDNCGSTLTWRSTKNPGDNFPLGTTPVTYTVTDAAGNTTTCVFKVTVEDNNPPQFSGCSDIKVNAGVSCETQVQWTSPIATDCGPVVVTSSHHSGDVFPIGTTEVTYTATDNTGNTSLCKFNVIVEDKTAPAFISCPANINITIANACEAQVSWKEPVVSDNCEAVTLSKSHTSGDLFPVGKTIVKYTATDAAGNTSTCEFEVTVKMGGAPVFENCPADQDLTAEESGTAIVDWTPPTATAGCGDVVLTSTHSPGDVFSPGATIVTYKAEDAFGNVSYCEFKVIVTPQEIDIAIGRLVTPDGNSDNDELIITNIEKFVKNKIIIVDRWGSVVYTASGYNNASVVWTGLSREGATLPTGTYFYTISVQYADKVFEKTGFIELIR